MVLFLKTGLDQLPLGENQNCLCHNSLLAPAVWPFVSSDDGKIPQDHLLSQDWSQTGRAMWTFGRQVFWAQSLFHRAQRGHYCCVLLWSLKRSSVGSTKPSRWSLQAVVSGNIHYFWVPQDTVQKCRCFLPLLWVSRSIVKRYSIYGVETSMLFIKLKGAVPNNCLYVYFCRVHCHIWKSFEVHSS